MKETSTPAAEGSISIPQQAPDNELNRTAQSLDNLTSRDYLDIINAQVEVQVIDKLVLEDIRPSVPWNLNDTKKGLMCINDDSFDDQFGKFLI